MTVRCKSCLSEVQKLNYAVRKDQILKQNQRWYEANKDEHNARRRLTLDREKQKARCKSYYESNKEAVRAANHAWAIANQEKVREYWRNYAKRNQDNRSALSAKRRASKLNATPRWDSELTDFVAKEASALARMRANMFGFEWDVDHIVPLAGKNVCGFHVWNNLQVIPSDVNRRKSNKFEVNR